ncbi:spindle pole body formation-associated protein-domain-containing protein [Truncatella angustata]|uniref:Spindle pole body formation-associated protein-domain-containing protein n=1 Tax=Truncatella angustata TaxID=152316 RepID=A0A9P8UF51_9PEZI|nr:spindle pole body formation-associated protein-domain-containing protein [Truncatella angustata]KAH6648838.1 spindle pole body formation-associated protein-domain-containing protein [Truncatella angustata]
MLGWALKKGIQGATGARDAPPEDGDTTQIEAPDTPAPVFAARAIQRAIFGTPAPRKETNAPAQRDLVNSRDDDALLRDTRSPAKPTGILLTPGTATARRKRVSFDHDTKAGTNGDPNSLAAKSTSASARKKTLQQRLEEARSNKSKKLGAETKSDSTKETAAATRETEPAQDVSDEEWEDDACNHDVTVDLNEPHSRSGKYWKSEFNKYSDDARAEMERLVKYKHLAKIYAQKKDAEAIELNQRLKEEQEKVKQMEEQLRESGLQTTSKRRKASDTDDTTLMEKLAEKTALAIRYRDRIKELESSIRDQDDGKLQHPRMDASPRTEKTLLETNRELRRARNELKEMKRMREDNERLKSDLILAEQRATKIGDENKRIVADSSRPPSVKKLEKQLRDAKEEAERKDDELKKLQREFDTLKENAKSSRSQALQVLKEKNDRIAELEQEVKLLKQSNASSSRPKSLDAALARHNKITQDLKADMASINKPSIHEKAKLTRPQRSMSAEDLTLDFTLQSLADSPSQRLGTQRFPSDLTDSLRDIEEQLRKERRDRMESRRRDHDLATGELDVPPLGTVANISTNKILKPVAGSRRVMSDKVNEAAPDKYQASGKPSISRQIISTGERAIMRDALDNLTNSRYTANSRTARAHSPNFELPGFDLLQNRFAKLGGPNRDDTILTANASRCTLPADRQAAARARLEQKRRSRQRLGGKENMRP